MSRVERWRGGLGWPNCDRPFRLPVSRSPRHAPFPPPVHRSGRADLPHPALRRASQTRPRPRPTAHPSPAHTAPAAAAEPWLGLLDRRVNPRGSWSLREHTRSQAPSLRRHYPAATVLRACPPPLGGPACPARASAWQEFPRHRWGFPCCVLHIKSFEACSAFTHVTACWLAGPPGGPWQRRLRRSRYLQRRCDCYRFGAKVAGRELHPLKNHSFHQTSGTP
jgi:hypothetical protein